MLNCLLSFLVLISTQETYTPEQGTTTGFPSLNTIMLRLKGRVIGTNIIKGMSLKEVEAIAGKDHNGVPLFFADFGITSYFPIHYDHLEMLVVMKEVFPKEARVDRVIFTPL